jgi:PAS domain S-box-containing protein
MFIFLTTIYLNAGYSGYSMVPSLSRKNLKDFCSVPYCCLSLSGKILDVNKEFMGLLGLRSSPEGKMFFSWLEKKSLKKKILLSLSKKRFGAFELLLKKADGTAVLVLVKGIREKEISHLMFQGISSKNDHMGSMMKQDGLYSALVENCQSGILLVIEGKIRFMNGPLLRMCSGDRSFRGKSVKVLVGEDGWKRIENKLREGSKEFLQINFKSGKGSFIGNVSSKKIHFEGKPAVLLSVLDLSPIIDEEKKKTGSEERFMTLANQTPNMIFINSGGRVVYVNNLAVSLMGYSREEYYSKSFNFLDIIDKRYHETLIKNFKKHHSGEEVDPYEYRLITKDQKKMDVFITTKLIKYNEEWAILGIVTDISALKESQRELRDRERFLQKLFDNMTSGFAMHKIILDKKGQPIDYVYLDVNKAFESLLGLKRKDIIGKRVTEIIPGIEKDPADWIGFFGSVAVNGHSSSTTNYSRSLKKWFSVKAFSLNPNEFIAVFDDVTGQYQAMQSLAESEDKYRSLVEQSSDGIILTDEDGTVVTWNDAMEKITGISRVKAEKKKIWDLQYLFIHPSKRKKSLKDLMKRKFREFLEGKELELKVREIEVFLDGKKRKILEEKIFSIRSKNSKLFCGLLKDVTERSEAVKALKKSEENYRLIVENQTDLVVKLDEKGHFLFVSPSYCKMFGKSEDKLIGKRFITVVFKDDRKKAEQAIQDIFNPPFTKYIEQRAITPKGFRWLAWIYTAVRDSDDKVIEIIGIGRDITEKKIVELEKRDLQKKLKRYTRHLETRVRNLERTDFHLTEKEKRVIVGLSANPLESDQVIGKEVLVNRSTVTSIKNRLRGRGIFSEALIPGPGCFGFELLTLVSGTFRSKIKKPEVRTLLGEAGFIFHVASESKFFGFFMSQNLVDLNEELKLFTSGSKKFALDGDPLVITIPVELASFSRYFDFSAFLANHFSLDLVNQKKVPFCTKNMNFSKNMKETLLTMVQHPEETTTEIAQRLRLTRNTISKNRRLLLDGGHIHKRIVPDLRKLNLGIISLAAGKPDEISNRVLPQTLFLVSGPRDVIRVDIFKSFNERTEEYAKLKSKWNSLVRRDFDLRNLIYRLDFSSGIAKTFGLEKKDF